MSTGIRCLSRVAIVLLMVFVFSSSVVTPQDTVAGLLGESLMKGLESMGKARVGTAKASAQIKRARAAYWSQFPDGPGLQEAQAKFAKMLASKDIYHLMFHLDIGGIGEKKTRARAKTAEMLGGSLDDGLWPGTERAFYDWVRAYRNALKKDDPFMLKWLVDPKLATAAYERSSEEYAAYERSRDRAEYMAAMDGLPFKNTKELTLALIALEEYFVREEDAVAKQYRKMVDEFGKKELHAAAEEVRKAPKNKFGRVANPSALGPFGHGHPYWALRGPLSRNSGKAYVWIILGEEQYKYWTAVIDEQQLIAAADRLRVLPHVIATGYSTIPFHLDTESSGFKALSREFENAANTVDPEELLKIICGKDPLHYEPRGASLDAKHPDSYMIAVIKHSNPDFTWHEARQSYRSRELGLFRHGRKQCYAAIEKVRKAPKDKQHRLKDPEAIGVSDNDPLQAVKELLQGPLSPKGMYIALYVDRHGYGAENRGEGLYDRLIETFGEERVTSIVQLVWQCMEEGRDISKLEGAVSGFETPLHVFGDILISTLPAEKYVDYLYGDRSKPPQKLYEQYGKDTFLTAAKKVAVTPKSENGFINRLYLPNTLADPASIGLGGRAAICRSAVTKLAQAILRNPKRPNQSRPKDPTAAKKSRHVARPPSKESLQAAQSPSKKMYVELFIKKYEQRLQRYAGSGKVSDRYRTLGAKYYDRLVKNFGEESVAPIASLVWKCMKEGEDFSQLEGAISGFQEPLLVFGDILISTMPVEKYASYLYSFRPARLQRVYDKYGKEAILAAATKVAAAPKTDRLGQFELPNVLADASSVGLKDSLMRCRSAVERLARGNRRSPRRHKRPARRQR